MSSPQQPESLTVVAMSPDAAFRRVAGAALSHAGHDVYTAASTPFRLERLVRLRRPDVVVLEVIDGTPMPTTSQMSRLTSTSSVVLVAATSSDQALDKWGPLDALVARVEAVAAGERHLRLVAGDS